MAPSWFTSYRLKMGVMSLASRCLSASSRLSRSDVRESTLFDEPCAAAMIGPKRPESETWSEPVITLVISRWILSCCVGGGERAEDDRGWHGARV